MAIVTRFAADMRALGPANFLYADSDVLFAHGHRRIQAGGEIAPPGLWHLQRRGAAPMLRNRRIDMRGRRSAFASARDVEAAETAVLLRRRHEIR